MANQNDSPSPHNLIAIDPINRRNLNKQQTRYNCSLIGVCSIALSHSPRMYSYWSATKPWQQPCCLYRHFRYWNNVKLLRIDLEKQWKYNDHSDSIQQCPRTVLVSRRHSAKVPITTIHIGHTDQAIIALCHRFQCRVCKKTLKFGIHRNSQKVSSRNQSESSDFSHFDFRQTFHPIESNVISNVLRSGRFAHQNGIFDGRRENRLDC